MGCVTCVTDSELHSLSQQVLDLLKGIVGVETFTQTYATALRALTERRDIRKRQRATQVSSVTRHGNYLKSFVRLISPPVYLSYRPSVRPSARTHARMPILSPIPPFVTQFKKNTYVHIIVNNLHLKYEK